MKKRIIYCFVLLAMFACLTIGAKPASAASTSDFTIVKGVLTEYTGSKVVVTVPDGVRRIAYSAFYGRKDIEKVILPATVRYIDSFSFENCTGLSTVIMQENLSLLGKGCFSGCTNLQNVDLSHTKISIVAEDTFEKCSSLSEVNLPKSVQVIGKQAFAECTHLGRVNLPEGLRSIGYGAFEGNHSLNTLKLPSTLTYLGEQALSDCISLSSITIPEGITSIQPYTFTGDYCLASVSLPDTLKVIAKGGLDTSNHYNSTAGALKSIYIPKSVEFIASKGLDIQITGMQLRGESGSYAETFANSNSKQFKFQSVTKDAAITLDACGGKVDYTEKTRVVGQSFGGLPVPALNGYRFTGWYTDTNFKKKITSISKIENTSYHLYARWEKAEPVSVEYQGSKSDFTIVDGVLKSYNGNESVVVVPEGVTELARSVFENKYFITTIILPEGLTKINTRAFSGCSSLLSLDIPEEVTEIPNQMCTNCSALETVAIPSGVTTIGDSAFASDVSNGSALHHVSVSDTLVSIGKNVFSHCRNLQTVNLPDSLTEIGSFAFSYCDVLRSIAIPSKVKVLPAYIFNYAYSLETITLTDGLETIEKEILDSNAALKELYIPETVTTIAPRALYDTKLTSFVIAGLKDSAAFDFYEGTRNSTDYKDIDITFREVKKTAVLKFDTQVDGMTQADQKAAVGCGYGILPEVSRDGYVFKGWSVSKDSTIVVKSTDAVMNETTTLYAVWKEMGASDDDGSQVEEPDGVPTILPNTDGDDDSEKIFVEISTPEQLSAIRDDLSGNYRLTNDIDLSSTSGSGSAVSGSALNLDGFGWRPIGETADGTYEAFTGTFDGNGYTIKGMSIHGSVPYTHVGLFARVEGGTIENIKMKDCDIQISNGATFTGAVAGFVSENGATDQAAVVQNCTVTGSIKYSTSQSVINKSIAIGGVLGYMGIGQLNDCRNAASVRYFSDEQEKPSAPFSRFLGGVTGYLQNGDIARCSNTGMVNCYRNYFGDFSTGDKNDVVSMALSGTQIYSITGGICGVAAEGGSITECYNKAKIASYMYNEYTLFTLNVTSECDTMAGGICGALYKSTLVDNCYNLGDIYSYAARSTTIKQETSSEIFNECFAELDAVTCKAPFQNSKGYAAGIVGYSTGYTSGPISHCYSNGKLTGTQDAVHGITNGAVPVSYCRYEETTLTNTDGTTAALVGSPKYENKISQCMPMSKDAEALQETYRLYDFANKWFLVDESGMQRPELVNNMESEVESVRFVGKPEKTEYKYGEVLDFTGLQIEVTLKGITQAMILNVPSMMECGYHACQSGNQKLSINYFGEKYEFSVHVAEETMDVVVNEGNGSGEYVPGQMVSLEANKPAEGMRFKEWKIVAGDVIFVDAKNASTTFVMPNDLVEVTAVYEKIYALTVNDGEGSGSYARGDVVTITAAPADGMEFSHWEVNSGSVSLKDDCSMQTTFMMPSYAVEITAIYREVVKSTEAPTVRPTQPAEATATPTTEPTLKPTEAPTTKPTVKPTLKPTTVPDVVPTLKPTTNPGTQSTPTVAPTSDNTNSSKNTVSKTTVTKVSKVKQFKAKASKKKLTLSWKALSGITGYRLQYSTSKNFKNKKTVMIKSSKKKYILKKLKGNKKYYIRICGVNKSLSGKYVTISKKTKK